MKINNPFGMIGYVDLDAQYKIDTSTKTLTINASGASDTPSVKWDSFESIGIIFEAEYRLDTPKTLIGATAGKGEFRITARWLASFSDKGVELKKDGNQPRDGGHKTRGDVVVSASAKLEQSNPGAKTPYVEMAVSLVAGDEDASMTVGLTNGTLQGGFSIGGSKGGSGKDLVFRINLKMDQPAKKEKVVVARIPPSLLAPEPILFKEDEDTLSAQSIRELHIWVSKAKDHESNLGSVIAQGLVPIEIQAFASTTGTAKYNKGETDRRLDSVEKILKSSQFFGSSKLKFKEKSHGMEKAEGKGPKNEYNRRVEIMINAAAAKQAVEKYASESGSS